MRAVAVHAEMTARSDWFSFEVTLTLALLYQQQPVVLDLTTFTSFDWNERANDRRHIFIGDAFAMTLICLKQKIKK